MSNKKSLGEHLPAEAEPKPAARLDEPEVGVKVIDDKSIAPAAEKGLEKLKGQALIEALGKVTPAELASAIGRASTSQAKRLGEQLLTIGEEALSEPLRGNARQGFAASALERAWVSGAKQEQTQDAANRVMELYQVAGETAAATNFQKAVEGVDKFIGQRLTLLLERPKTPPATPGRPETPAPEARPEVVAGNATLADLENLLDEEVAASEAGVVGEGETITDGGAEGEPAEEGIKEKPPLAWDLKAVKARLKEEAGIDLDKTSAKDWVKKERNKLDERVRELEAKIRTADEKECVKMTQAYVNAILVGDYFSQSADDEEEEAGRDIAGAIVNVVLQEYTFKADDEKNEKDKFYDKNITPLNDFMEEIVERYAGADIRDRLVDLAQKRLDGLVLARSRSKQRKGKERDREGKEGVKGLSKEEEAKQLERVIKNWVERYKRDAKRDPLRYALANAESYFYSSLNQGEGDIRIFVEEDFPVIRGVIVAFAKESGISEEELNTEVAAVTAERAEQGDEFRYGADKKKGLEWFKEAKLPELRKKLGLKDKKSQDQFYPLADFLEAGRRMVKKTVEAKREAERAERARRQALEEDARRERLSQEWLHARGDFLALLQLTKTKGKAAVTELLARPEEEREEELKTLLRAALKEKGFSVPGGSDYDVSRGTAFARSLDRIELTRTRKDGRTTTNVHYGYVVGESPDGTLDFQFVSRTTRKLIGTPAMLRSGEYRDLRKAIPASVDGRAGLELFDMAGVSVRTRGNLRDPEQGWNNVNLVRAGQHRKGTIAINTGHFDGVTFDGLYEYNQAGRRTVLGNEGIFEQFKRLRDQGKLADFDFDSVDLQELTLIIDHHGSTSTKESAASAYALEFLDANGLLNESAPEETPKRQALNRALQFIRYDDNKTHPAWGDNWEKDSPWTILGLARHLTLKKLIEFFEAHPEDDAEIRPFEKAELEKYVDREDIERQEETVLRARGDLQRLKDNGYVVEDTRLGSLIVLTPVGEEAWQKKKNEQGEVARDEHGKPQWERVLDENGRRVWNYRQRHLTGGIDAARAILGPDAALMYWDPLNKRAFLSTTGKPLDLPKEVAREGMELRKTMFIVDPERDDLVADFTLAEFLDLAARPKDGELKLGGGLKRYIETTETAQRRYIERKAEVRTSNAKELAEMMPKEWRRPLSLMIEQRGPRAWVSLPPELRRERGITIKGPDGGQLDPSQIDPARQYVLKLIEHVGNRVRDRVGKPDLFVLQLKDLEGVEKAPEVIDPIRDLGFTNEQVELARSAARDRLLQHETSLVFNHFKEVVGVEGYTMDMARSEAKSRVTDSRVEAFLQIQYTKKWEKQREKGNA